MSQFLSVNGRNPDGEKVRIATLNVHGQRARLSNLLEWLNREQPDIACLHLLPNPTLRPYLHEAGMDAWGRNEPHASDHAPTWVRIQSRKKS